MTSGHDSPLHMASPVQSIESRISDIRSAQSRIRDIDAKMVKGDENLLAEIGYKKKKKR